MRLGQKQQGGFTLIELLVVIAIIAMLFAISTINLGKANTGASETSTVQTLLADLKSQQLLAMSGDSGSTTSQQPHGIFVQSDKYVLFADASYNVSDPNDFAVNMNGDVTLSTTLSGNEVVFQKGDGSVAGFTNGSNTITVADGGSSQTITINRFGATTVQ